MNIDSAPDIIGTGLDAKETRESKIVSLLLGIL